MTINVNHSTNEIGISGSGATISPPLSSYADLRLVTPVAGKSIRIVSGSGGIDGDFYTVTGAAPGTYTDNNGTIIVPTGGDGSAAWLRDYSGPLNSAWFGAVGDGVTVSRALIQKAIDAIPSTGGSLFIPSGTYILDTTPLNARGKNNVKIYGAGMGNTILYAPNGNTSVPTGGGNGYGMLTFGDYTSATTILNNFQITDISFRGSNASTIDKLVCFDGINNVVIERVEFYEGYNEVLYCTTGSSRTIDGITVRDCYFHNCTGSFSYSINTNALAVSNITIKDNIFKQVSWGCLILGSNIVIADNKLVDINGVGIKVAESNFSATKSISSCVIRGNVFEGLGWRSTGYNEPATRGIVAGGWEKSYADGTQDNGVIVSNNTFKNLKTSATNSVTCIQASGSALIENNFASNVATTGGNSAFISVIFTSDYLTNSGLNSYPSKIYLKNNVLEKYSTGNAIQYGINVWAIQNSYLYCKGNIIDAGVNGAYFSGTGYGYLPFVSYDGDIIGPNNLLYRLAGNDALLGSSPPPIYGDNTKTFYSQNSRDLFSSLAERDLTGLTTPSVDIGAMFYTNNTAPTSITNFTNTLPKGSEITITFIDANTTVVHNASLIKLNGGVNFVSTAFSSLTLYKPNVAASTAWIEKSRKV